MVEDATNVQQESVTVFISDVADDHGDDTVILLTEMPLITIYHPIRKTN